MAHMSVLLHVLASDNLQRVQAGSLAKEREVYKAKFLGDVIHMDTRKSLGFKF